jgi:hypothetical protein
MFSPSRFAAKERRRHGGSKLGQTQFCFNIDEFPPLQARSQKLVLNPAAAPYQKSGFSPRCDENFYSNRQTPPDPIVSYPEGFTYHWPDTADDDLHDNYYYRDEDDDFIAF